MNRYRITSKASVDHGIWSGVTPTHALSRMFTDAGYKVGYSAITDELIWASSADRKITGTVEDWQITLV